MKTVEQYMQRAIQLSYENMQSGAGGPFGAVVVKDGQIIGEGWNKVTSKNDPTAHAEVEAIRDACQKIQNFDLSGCQIYTSCEPCPMCLSAIYWARIEHIYYANTKEDAAHIQFDDAFIYQEIPKAIKERRIQMTPLMRDQALQIFQIWAKKSDKVQY